MTARVNWTENNNVFTATLNGNELRVQPNPTQGYDYFFNGELRGTRYIAKHAMGMVRHLANTPRINQLNIVGYQMSTRTFGVEIEISKLRNVSSHITAAGMIEAEFQRRGIPVVNEVSDYNHRVPTAWAIRPDGTVSGSGGVEIVSPVLQGEAGLQQIREVCAALNALHAVTNRNSGLHVHIYTRDLTDMQRARVGFNWIRAQRYTDCFMPISRRENNGHYCRQNPVRSWTNFQASYYVEGMINGGSRYRKLNAQSYARYGTYEFRHHSGTTDADKITNWIILLDAFVTFSATSSDDIVTGVMNETTMRNFLTQMNVPDTTVDFYLRRARHFRMI